MSTHTLRAFHGAQAQKEAYLSDVRQWLQSKQLPEDPFAVVEEIFNPIKTFKSSDCILENYRLYPGKLGLPLWLVNLFSTIQLHNAKPFYSSGRNFEQSFYESFLSACNVGVDYTLLLHKWEFLLLTEFIPEQESTRKNIQSVIKLHQKALSGAPINIKEWRRAQKELETTMNGIDEYTGVSKEMLKQEIDALENLNRIRGTAHFEYIEKHKEYCHMTEVRKAVGQITWHSCRVAYLSIREVVDVRNSWASSAEAVVDARWQQALLSGAGTLDNRLDLQQKTWCEIMDRLIMQLKDWK